MPDRLDFMASPPPPPKAYHYHPHPHYRLIDGGFERPRNGGKNDKAHPPIHPTANASNLMGDEKRVYEYVTRRFLASCSTNALGKLTTVEIEIAGEFFSTSGGYQHPYATIEPAFY